MVLYQSDDGYCFNSDTIFLYDFITQFPLSGKVLDVGAGCGVLGLLVARDNPKIDLEAVEIQTEMAKFAKKNAQANEIPYHLYETDFLSFVSQKKYDAIISNPPFYHDGVQKTQNPVIHKARYNEHLPIDAFFRKVKQLLKPRGRFLFCYDESQLQHLLVALEKVKLTVEDIRFVHPKKEKKASLVMIHARESSKSYMKIHSPLIAFEQGEFSAEAQAIYQKAKTESVKCKIS